MLTVIKYFNVLKDTIKNNLLFLSLIIVYRIAAEVINIDLNRKDFSGCKTTVPFLIQLTVLVYIVIFLVKLLTNFKHGINGISIAVKQMKDDFFTSRSLANISLIILCIPTFFFSFTSFKTSIPYYKDFYLDKFFARMDYFIHFNNDPWIILNNFLHNPTITELIGFVYHHIWGVFLLFSIIITNIKHDYRLRKQYLLSFILTWILLGSVMAFLLSSAGPCFFGNIYQDTNPYAKMMLYLQSITELNVNFIREALWNVHLSDEIIYYTGISAMPSIHVASSTLFALLGFNLNRYLGMFLFIFLIFIQIGSIHLGWHYAIDGYVSIIMTIIIWKITKFIIGKTNNTKKNPPVSS